QQVAEGELPLFGAVSESSRIRGQPPVLVGTDAQRPNRHLVGGLGPQTCLGQFGSGPGPRRFVRGTVPKGHPHRGEFTRRPPPRALDQSHGGLGTAVCPHSYTIGACVLTQGTQQGGPVTPPPMRGVDHDLSGVGFATDTFDEPETDDPVAVGEYVEPTASVRGAVPYTQHRVLGQRSDAVLAVR